MADDPKTNLWRYRVGRWLVHFGIWVMPPGRSRSELTALLWTWNMRVTATLTAQEASHAE